ncbi:hypothetical protein C4573_02330 [Candidatus Woesearchaeota archaeon]|nr:MAG: hypothetical protein C4573_02330 [Candidatus Woesearchaeota archaeon]
MPKQIALQVQKQLQQRLQELDFIVSATLIGEPVETRVLEKINDLDNVVIVQGPMTKDKYATLQSILEELKHNQTQETDVLYAIADGPFKPASEKENEIFIHFILHTEESYKRSPLLLVKRSWQDAMPYLGKPLGDIQKIPDVDNVELLYGELGIANLRNLVDMNRGCYLGWKTIQNSSIMRNTLFDLNFTEPSEQLELYFYAILRSASNALRYVTDDNTIGIGMKMTHHFEQHFSIMTHSGIPRQAYLDKRHLRNRALALSEQFAREYQRKAMDFLFELQKGFETYTR